MDSINTPVQITEQQPIIFQPDAPWLLMDGKYTPDEHLKTLTPSRDMQTWEKYVSWLEKNEPRTDETLLPPKKYDELCDQTEESIFVNAESGADNDLRNFVAKYLMHLTPQQRRVLELIFWEGQSERDVADLLGVKQQSVHDAKKRAFKKIRGLIEGHCRLPYMRGLISSHVQGGTHERTHWLAEVDLDKAG